MGLLVGLSLMVAGIWAGRQLHIVWNIVAEHRWHGGARRRARSLAGSLRQGRNADSPYTPKIEFRYTVGGRDYTTEAPSVYTADTYDQAAANLARMYAPGTHHPIRYNPRDPRDIQFWHHRVWPAGVFIPAPRLWCRAFDRRN